MPNENKNPGGASQIHFAQPRCVSKVADILTGTDPIFTITGGPVRATFYGRVTTLDRKSVV